MRWRRERGTRTLLPLLPRHHRVILSSSLLSTMNRASASKFVLALVLLSAVVVLVQAADKITRLQVGVKVRWCCGRASCAVPLSC